MAANNKYSSSERKSGKALIDDFRTMGKRVFKEKYGEFEESLLNERVNAAFESYSLVPCCNGFSFNTIYGILTDRFKEKKTIVRSVGRPFSIYKKWEEEAPELFAEISKSQAFRAGTFMKDTLTQMWDFKNSLHGLALFHKLKKILRKDSAQRNLRIDLSKGTKIRSFLYDFCVPDEVEDDEDVQEDEEDVKHDAEAAAQDEEDAALIKEIEEEDAREAAEAAEAAEALAAEALSSLGDEEMHGRADDGAAEPKPEEKAPAEDEDL